MMWKQMNCLSQEMSFLWKINSLNFMHKISNEQGKTSNNAVEDYLAEEELEP